MPKRKTSAESLAALLAFFPLDQIDPMKYRSGYEKSPRWWGKQIYLRVQIDKAVTGMSGPNTDADRKALVTQLLQFPLARPSHRVVTPGSGVSISDMEYQEPTPSLSAIHTPLPVSTLKINTVAAGMKIIALTDDRDLPACIDGAQDFFIATCDKRVVAELPADTVVSPQYLRAARVDLRANDEVLMASFAEWLDKQRTENGTDRIKSEYSVAARIEDWISRRYLLRYDAELWCKVHKSGVYGAMTRSAELALLEGQPGNWTFVPAVESGNNSFWDAKKNYFNLERAYALLAT